MTQRWRLTIRLSPLQWVVAGLSLVTFVTGTAGYLTMDPPDVSIAAAMQSQPGTLGHVLDAVYLSLGLFFGNCKSTGTNGFLMVGRWAGVLSTFTGLLGLLIPQFEAWVRRVRIWFLGKHTVIIGLGEKGDSFARDAADHGARVIALDLSDRRTGLVDLAPGSRPIFVLGDSSDVETIHGIGLNRAQTIVITTNSDVTNLAVARMIGTAARARLNPHKGLDVLVHVSDPVLRIDGRSGLKPRDGVNIRLFSVPALAASNLEGAWPFGVLAELRGAEVVHVVFVGFDDFSEEILLQTLSRSRSTDPNVRPHVTIFSTEGKALELRLEANFPAIKEQKLASEFKIIPFDPRADFTQPTLAEVEATRPVTAIVVTAASDVEAFALARRVRARTNQLGMWLAPIFVRLKRPEGFASALRPIATTMWLSRAIESFGGVRSVCSAEAISSWDAQARAVHDAWKAKEPSATRSAAAREWECLDEENRQANRRAVDHFRVKLAYLGYIVRHNPPILRRTIALDSPAIEWLAELEHESWMVEKWLAGWSRGPVRDPVRRRHENLVPYAELGEIQEKDREQNRIVAKVFAPVEGAQSQACFRERRFALVSDAGPQVTVAALAERVETLFRELDYAARLGSSDELWTFVTTLSSPSEVSLAQAVRGLMNPYAAQGDAGARYRFVIARVADKPGAVTTPASTDEIDHFTKDHSDVELVVDVPERRGMLGYLLGISDLVIALRTSTPRAQGLAPTLAQQIVEGWSTRGVVRVPPLKDDSFPTVVMEIRV